jgi:N-acetylmuramoyl-L-alanine amidase
MNYYDNSDPSPAVGWQQPRSLLWRLAHNNAPTLVFLGLALAGMLVVYWYFKPTFGYADTAVAAALPAENSLSAPIYKDVPTNPVVQRVRQSPGPIRVGIIAGHKDNDSGAVCDDGLTEASINATIANQVASNLQAQGIVTEILGEFDPLLHGYFATALISIHADSCTYFNDLATGFKIAGSSYTDSQALSICVEQAYSDSTQLPYHSNTITEHMTDYHAFREISPGTPAIIVETGFMNQDRNLLTTEVDRPATGITNGILCFLKQ